MKIDFDERDPSQSQYIGSTLDEIALLSWMAGIWEGEGSVSITGPGRRLKITVVNTDKMILKPFVDLYGGSVSKHSDVVRRRPCFTWEQSGFHACHVLVRILPYIRGNKKVRVLLGIEFQTRIRATSKAEAAKEFGSLTEYKRIKESYFVRMKALNKRGRDE